MSFKIYRICVTACTLIFLTMILYIMVFHCTLQSQICYYYYGRKSEITGGVVGKSCGVHVIVMQHSRARVNINAENMFCEWNSARKRS